MIRRYLRQKVDDWKAKDNDRITQIAMNMHKQTIDNLMEKVP